MPPFLGGTVMHPHDAGKVKQLQFACTHNTKMKDIELLANKNT